MTEITTDIKTADIKKPEIEKKRYKLFKQKFIFPERMSWIPAVAWVARIDKDDTDDVYKTEKQAEAAAQKWEKEHGNRKTKIKEI